MRYQEEDRKHREALEKQSPSGPRRNLVSILNDNSRARAEAEAPGLEALEAVRKRQRGYGIHSAPSLFNFRESDPGQVGGSRFEWAEGALRLKPGKVIRDSAGEVKGEKERYQPTGEPESIDAAFLLETARRIIEMVRQRSYSQKPV